MQFRHDELAWFTQSMTKIEFLILATVASLVICMLAAVGVYIISQLLTAWRHRLQEPGRRRRGQTSVDTWRESASRLRAVDDEG